MKELRELLGDLVEFPKSGSKEVDTNVKFGTPSQNSVLAGANPARQRKKRLQDVGFDIDSFVKSDRWPNLIVLQCSFNQIEQIDESAVRAFRFLCHLQE